MKKLLAFAIILLIAIGIWNSIDSPDMYITVGDAEFDGPVGSVLGVLLTAVGVVIGIVALAGATIISCVACAGAGIVVALSLVLVAVILIAVAAPFLLPVLVPLGIFWWITRRNKHKQQAPMLQHAV